MDLKHLPLLAAPLALAACQQPANWEGGVWTLPPSNSGDVAGAGDTGESDRMTLLFRKR